MRDPDLDRISILPTLFWWRKLTTVYDTEVSAGLSSRDQVSEVVNSTETKWVLWFPRDPL